MRLPLASISLTAGLLKGVALAMLACLAVFGLSFHFLVMLPQARDAAQAALLNGVDHQSETLGKALSDTEGAVHMLQGWWAAGRVAVDDVDALMLQGVP